MYESGSSQHASSMEDPENSIFFPIGHPCYFDPEVMATKMLGRRWRKADAGIFRHEYLFSDDSSERKTCIRSDGTFSWDDKSSGIMWVGVLGKDTICVVTMTGDVDMTRARGSLRWCTKESVLREFRKLVISEIEDLEGRVGVMYKMAGKYTKMPFSVVSMIRRTNEVDKESGHEASSDDFVENKALNLFLEKFTSIQPPTWYDEKKRREIEKRKRGLASTLKEASSRFAVYDEKMAIEFLQEKMKSSENMSLDETIQTAISAFQHLLQKKFKANEIEVSIIDPYGKVKGQDVLYVESGLKVLGIMDIVRHLAIINGPSILREQKLTPASEARRAKAQAAEARRAKAQAAEARKAKVVVEAWQSNALRLGNHP